MSQPALRFAASAPAPVVNAATERYLVETFARYEQTLRATVPRLDEPRPEHPARALQVLEMLVESLAGLAVGAAIAAIRRELPEPVRAAVIDRLVKLAPSHAPVLTIADWTAPRYLPDASERPLVDALGAHLHARICRAVTDARTGLAAIRSTIDRVAPDQVDHYVAVLDRLALDDTAAVTFADHLAIGWQTYLAAIGAGTAPSVPAESRWSSARALWRAWRRRIDREPLVVEQTHDQVVAAGYMMRIS